MNEDDKPTINARFRKGYAVTGPMLWMQTLLCARYHELIHDNVPMPEPADKSAKPTMADRAYQVLLERGPCDAYALADILGCRDSSLRPHLSAMSQMGYILSSDTPRPTNSGMRTTKLWRVNHAVSKLQGGQVQAA